MTEDPRYLRNQSLVVHRLHGRGKRLLRWFAILWLLVVGGITAAAALDVVAKLGWGYEPGHVWAGLLMIAGGCAFWLAANAISHVVLALSRRLYGPEPVDPPKG